MPTNQDIEWSRGQTEQWMLTITQVDGSPEDLTGEMVEFEIKKYDGAPDPAVLHLDDQAGIAVRVQTGANVGVCDLTATKTQTFSLAGGDLALRRLCDAVQGGSRKRAMFGKARRPKDIINFP
jgi:hypothetical protein